MCDEGVIQSLQMGTIQDFVHLTIADHCSVEKTKEFEKEDPNNMEVSVKAWTRDPVEQLAMAPMNGTRTVRSICGDPLSISQSVKQRTKQTSECRQPESLPNRASIHLHQIKPTD